MILYDTNEKKKYETISNDEITNVLSKNKDHRYFFVCQNSQIKVVEDFINIDNSFIDQVFSSQDQYISYTNYDDYDFLSVMLISKKNVHTIIKVFFSENFLILSTPDGMVNEDVIWLQKRINEKMLRSFGDKYNVKNEIVLGYAFYNIFDSIVRFFSQTLEEVEDRIEFFIGKISKDPSINNKETLLQIEQIRKLSYSIRKHIRALETITATIEQNENQFFPTELNHLLRLIKRRADAILKFSESVYSFSEQLILSYNSKISNQTNILVMRLTVITIIFSLWTVVAGVYGMNFDNMPELRWVGSYFILIGVLIVITCILLYIFRKKKWI